MGCLIITEYLPSPSDWNMEKDDIPNLHNRRVEVANVAGRQVTLSCNATLKLDSKFDRGSHQIAYNVIDGIVLKGKVKSTKGKLSKKEPVKAVASDVRKVVYKAVTESQNVYSSCLGYVASFLHHLSATKSSVLPQIVPFFRLLSDYVVYDYI